jgi:hypothetical protein
VRLRCARASASESLALPTNFPELRWLLLPPKDMGLFQPDMHSFAFIITMFSWISNFVLKAGHNLLSQLNNYLMKQILRNITVLFCNLRQL